jgi:prephenate dehydrogenase
MKALLVGTGGVGESIAVMAKEKPWIERVVLSDYSTDRLEEFENSKVRFPIEWWCSYQDQSSPG